MGLVGAVEVGVDEVVDFAVKYGVGVGAFVLGAGVFDEFVGLEDVVADLLAPFGGLAGAEFADAGGVLFLLHLSEFTAEDFQGFGLVLLLGAFVLDGDDGAGREMGDTDGGVGSVDALTAVAAGVVDVNAEVLVVQLDGVVGGDDGEDFHEGEGSLAEVVGVKGREADQTVDAVLAF